MDNTSGTGDEWPTVLSRRQLLGGSAAVTAGVLAGCLGGDGGTRPDPIDLAGGKQCDVCGMIIGDHYGPNAQIFYVDNSPESHANPAYFESLKACMFPYYFAHENYGWEVAAVYATDYSRTDYSLPSAGDRTYISTHTAAETFADATALSYVVGSAIDGAMGGDFLPFSASEDANAFADEHGGEVLAFEDITPAIIGD
jgi:copper chaperone NosL